MKIEELYIGQSYTMSKRFSLEDVIKFSEISLDNNLVHINEEYASNTVFKKRIVHGFLTASLFSAIIGTKLPGNGSIYLKQDMNFRKPIFHDELVTAIVTIREIRKDKPIITLETICYNENNEIATEGTAIVKLINI